MALSGKYAALGNKASELVDPKLMPVTIIDARYLESFRNAQYAGLAVERFAPNSLTDRRRGLVVQLNEETRIDEAVSVSTANYSLATLQKYEHKQLPTIKVAIYKAHYNSFSPNNLTAPTALAASPTAKAEPMTTEQDDQTFSSLFSKLKRVFTG